MAKAITKSSSYENVSSVEMSNLPNVKIVARNGKETKVTLSGGMKTIEDISIENMHGNLIIKGPDYGNDITVYGGGTVSVGRNSVSVGRGGIFVGGSIRAGGTIVTGDLIVDGKRQKKGQGRIIVDGVDVTDDVKEQQSVTGEEPELIIELTVPERINLALKDITTSVVSGIIGSMELSSGGSENHVIESVSKIKASVSGSADIKVGEVKGGKNKINISGSGRVSVKSGKMDDLIASISGHGSVDIGADVEDADLEVSGAGNINVKNVAGTLDKDISGAGRINIGNR